VLDLNLPGLGGLELLRRLTRMAPKSPIRFSRNMPEAIYATSAGSRAPGICQQECCAGGFWKRGCHPGRRHRLEKSVQREMAMRDLAEDAI